MAASIFPVPLSGIQETKLTTTGDTLYASAANTAGRLGIGSTGQVLTVASGLPSWSTPATPTFVGAVVYRSAAQALTLNTYVASNFANESLDTNTFHDNSTNNSRLTVPSGYAGKYLLFAGDVNIENASQCGFAFFKNGSTADPTGQNTYSNGVNSGGQTESLGGSIIVSASVADYFELFMTTDGSSRNSNRAVFGCTYLGA